MIDTARQTEAGHTPHTADSGHKAHAASPGYTTGPAATTNGEAHMSVATGQDQTTSGTGLKKLLLGGVAIGLLALVTVVWILPALTTPGTSGGEERKHSEKSEPLAAVQMKVMKPLPGRERTTTQPASLESFAIVKIRPQATGTLAHQVVDIDSDVKKGFLMAEIDAPDLVAERAEAKANWERAKADKILAEKQVEVVQNQLEGAKQMIVQRNAEYKSAAAYLRFRGAELVRYEGLLKDKAIDARVVDEERDRFEAADAHKIAAKAAEETSRLDVKAKEAQLDKARADVKVAEAAIGVAKGRFDKANALVSFTQIKAPFDGVVTVRNYNDGAYIRSVQEGGQDPLLVVNRIDKFRVIVMIPAVDVPFVRKGDKADLVIKEIRPEPFPGIVSRTANSEDINSRTMRIEVDVDNQRDESGQYILRNGMYGSMTVYMKHAPKPEFMLPSNTVHQDLETETRERFVYTVQNKHAHKTYLKVGPDDGKLIGIMSGLKKDDLVVIQDNGMLKEGTEVAPELMPTTRAPKGRPAD